MDQAALNIVNVNMVNDSKDPHGQCADLGCTYIVVVSPSVVIVLIPVQTDKTSLRRLELYVVFTQNITLSLNQWEKSF